MGLRLSKSNNLYATTRAVNYDSSAYTYISTVGTLNSLEQISLNQLVVDFKNYGIWSKMKVVYPMIGGTATAHKWNLINPQDTNAAFRLSFSGGWTHSATGALPDGISGYGDTFLVPNTSLTLNNYHYSYYSGTQALTPSHEFGAYTNGSTAHTLNLYLSSVSLKMFQAGDYPSRTASVNNTNTLGFQIGSRTANNLANLFFNGSKLATTTNLWSGGMPIHKAFLAALSTDNVASGYSSKECRFASIGDGLTDTEAANMYTAVQAFNTNLGRAV